MDDLDQLTDAVTIIANKHVSLNIQPEHYQDVGTELLKSIKEILGEAATDEIINAWKVAYFHLADIFIGIEENMRKKLQENGKILKKFVTFWRQNSNMYFQNLQLHFGVKIHNLFSLGKKN